MTNLKEFIGKTRIKNNMYIFSIYCVSNIILGYKNYLKLTKQIQTTNLLIRCEEFRKCNYKAKTSTETTISI